MSEPYDSTEIDQYLTELSHSAFFGDPASPESFAYMTAYYRDRAWRKRIWFRAMSVAVIVLSGVLPLIAAFAHDALVWSIAFSKDFVVAAISAAIAILTGLTTHFRWDVGWRSQTEALFALQGLKAEWEGAIARARLSKSADRLAELAAAFERFRTRTFEVVHAEMGDFFKVQQAPTGKLPPT
jgi:hypothetical protein